MKTSELFEAKGVDKKQILMDLLTSETFEKNKEVVIDALVKRLSNLDLDELVASIKGDVPDQDDLEFRYTLIQKMFAEYNPELKLSYGSAGMSRGVIGHYKLVGPAFHENAVGMFSISYARGKWVVETWSEGTKRFNTENEATDYVTATIAKDQKKAKKELPVVGVSKR